MGSLARGLAEKEFYSGPVEERRKGSRADSHAISFFFSVSSLFITTYLRAVYLGGRRVHGDWCPVCGRVYCTARNSGAFLFIAKLHLNSTRIRSKNAHLFTNKKVY